MTQLLTLRKEVCGKLRGISLRQLRNIVREVSAREGIPDRDVALLLVAQRDGKLPIQAPRFNVPEEKIGALKEHLKSSRASLPFRVNAIQKKEQSEQPKPRRLLNFQGKYPAPVFYDPLEAEINRAYSIPFLPNAVLLLSRKLIENLVYNLLQFRFDGPGVALYYNTSKGRAHDFSVLLDNLKDHKLEFDPDHQGYIDQFLKIIEESKFRREANSTVHNVMDYLGSMHEISRFKIPAMTQLLLLLIGRVMKPEPKSLNVTKAEHLENGLLITVMNAGIGPATLTDYTVEDLPRRELFHKEVIIQPGETSRLVLQVPAGFKFEHKKPVRFSLWLNGDIELPFQYAIRIRKP